MNKTLSTFEREMQDENFRRIFEEGYQELLFSELMISLMENDDKSVRKLAHETSISPSIIQNLRSGKQEDIKVKNLLKIALAFGYELCLKKDDKQFVFQNTENLTLKEI